MKDAKAFFTLACAFLLTWGHVCAQSNFGLTVGTSRSDRHVETLWYQQRLSRRFSVGLQVRNSDVRYRFVDARAVERANTLFAGLTLGYQLAAGERYRLDLNATASYRYLGNEERPELPKTTAGLELDPNLIFSLALDDRFVFHTGAMLRTAVQLSPEVIGDEQLPSAIVLAGLSRRVGAGAFAVRAYAGPMNGANGDTEKFFWQLSVGYQYNLNFKNADSLPYFNF